MREFREETGYECEVVSVSPVQAADPGLSSANMQLVMVEVKLGEADEVPEQRLEDGENIERAVVPLAELYERLVEYSKRERMIPLSRQNRPRLEMVVVSTLNAIERNTIDD